MPPRKASSTRAKAKGKPGLSLAVDSPPSQKTRPLSFFAGYQPGVVQTPASAPKALLPAPNSPAKGKGKATDTPHLLWSDLFAPKKRDEVAVHKKKVEQVEGWLREAFHGRSSLRKYRRLLVLSGPAGAGKSAVLRALSQQEELDFNVVEWVNEMTSRGGGSYSEGQSDGRPAIAQGFDNFLHSAGRYPSLSIGTGASSPSAAQDDHASIDVNEGSGRHIVLVEDLPNVQHPATRAAFHDSIRAFVASKSEVPLVVIVSETTPRLDEYGAGGSGSSRDWRDRQDETLDVRGLIPEEIRNGPYCTQISFNSIAPTILCKALKLALDQARKHQTGANLPASSSIMGKEVVTAIAETANGDVRSALNALQFACVQDRLLRRFAAEGRGIKRTSQGKKKNQEIDLRKTLSAITGRESSMALFHALGKVLYNKRYGDPTDDSDGEDEEGNGLSTGSSEASLPAFSSLPPHLSHLSRRRSKVDVESLWRSLPLDPSTFVSYLHQNYPPFTSTIDQCADVADHLSFADAELRPNQGGDPWSSASTTDYYGFLVGTKGSLLSLPSPVPQRSDRFSPTKTGSQRSSSVMGSSQANKKGFHKFSGVKMFHNMKRRRELEDMVRESKDRGEDRRLGATMNELVTLTYPMMAKMGKGAYGSNDVTMRVGRLDWEEITRNCDGIDEDEAVEEAALDGGQQADKEPSSSIVYDFEGRKLIEEVSKDAIGDEDNFGDEYRGAREAGSEEDEDEEIEDADG